MQCLSGLLLAISSNLDNLGVGIAYGVRGVRLFWLSNLLIALLTSAGTCGAMSLGSWLSQALLPGVAEKIGAILIMGAGVWVIWLDRQQSGGEDLRSKQFYLFLKEPFRADTDHSKSISLSEAALLGLALTLNNISSGIGAGLTGMPVISTTCLVFILSLCMMTGGLFIGRRFASGRLGDKAGLAGGLLLILIGCYELFI